MNSITHLRGLKHPVFLYKTDSFSLCCSEEISIKNINKLETFLIYNLIDNNNELQTSESLIYYKKNFSFEFSRTFNISEWSIRSQTMKIINLINMLKEIKILNEC
jgi:hypothetical protein